MPLYNVSIGDRLRELLDLRLPFLELCFVNLRALIELVGFGDSGIHVFSLAVSGRQEQRGGVTLLVLEKQCAYGYG